ncbi:MAG: sterol desaturase family protein [Rhodospirillaceae bacterium]
MLIQDPMIRPLMFVGLAILFTILEAWQPRRQKKIHRTQRWVSNYGILILGALLARFTLPLLPVGAAVWALENDVGLLNELSVPIGLAGLIAFLFLDILIYWQHRLFHAVPILWRFHRIHHMDLEFDVSTGVRFHPIEILLSLILKIGAVIALGAHPLTVIVFEIALNGISLFNHANLALSASLDRIIRLFLVSPDMHRIHHSVRQKETDSNFCFLLSWWDFIFRTYRAQPEGGHINMTVGLNVYRDDRTNKLSQLLVQPFIADHDTRPS